MGERQKGRNDLKLASLRRDREWVQRAREVAFELVDADPDLAGHPALADEVEVFLGDDERPTSCSRADGTGRAGAGREAPQVAVVVAPGLDLVEPRRGQGRGQHLVLLATHLDQQPAPGPEPAAGPGHDATDQVEPVAPAVEGPAGLVAPDVRAEQSELAGGHVGRDPVTTSRCGTHARAEVRSATTTGTPLRRAHRAAVGSRSTPTTVALGTSARRCTATAPAPVHRSTARPCSANRDAARRASSSLWILGT